MCFRSSNDDKYPPPRPIQYGNDYNRYLRDLDRYQKDRERYFKKKRRSNNASVAASMAVIGSASGGGC